RRPRGSSTARSSGDTAVGGWFRLREESWGLLGQRVRAGIQIVLGTDGRAVTHSGRRFEQSLPTEPFLADTEMHRLKSGGNRANDRHSIRGDVGGSEVYKRD